MVRNSEPKKKTKSSKWYNVGLSLEVYRNLKRVCDFHGWKKTEAVKRLVLKELSALNIAPEAASRRIPAVE